MVQSEGRSDIQRVRECLQRALSKRLAAVTLWVGYRSRSQKGAAKVRTET